MAETAPNRNGDTSDVGETSKIAFPSYVHKFKEGAQQFPRASHVSTRVYGRETSARPPNADFQMVLPCANKLRKQRGNANGRRLDESEKVRENKIEGGETRRRRATYDEGKDVPRGGD